MLSLVNYNWIWFVLKINFMLKNLLSFFFFCLNQQHINCSYTMLPFSLITTVEKAKINVTKRYLKSHEKFQQLAWISILLVKQTRTEVENRKMVLKFSVGIIYHFFFFLMLNNGKNICIYTTGIFYKCFYCHCYK